MHRSFVTAIAMLAGLGLAYSASAQTTPAPSSTTAPAPSATMPPPSNTASPPPMTQNSPQTNNVSKQQIEQAQQDLKKAGLYKGQIDGEIGAETRKAVEDFQKEKGINPTGSLDQQTIQALSQEAQQPSQGGTKPPATNQR